MSSIDPQPEDFTKRTLEAMSELLDTEDAETGGHSRRVTAFTLAIANRMGVPKDQMMIISRAAYLTCPPFLVRG